MYVFDWIDWIDRWFTYEAGLFWAGVFVGFLFFCFACILYDWLLTRRSDEK